MPIPAYSWAASHSDPRGDCICVDPGGTLRWHCNPMREDPLLRAKITGGLGALPSLPIHEAVSELFAEERQCQPRPKAPFPDPESYARESCGPLAGPPSLFILSGSEDLVPILEPEDKKTAPGYIIHRYRPRIEGLFARIERWTNADPEKPDDVYWRSISKDNILSLYGKDSNSRIYDPADSARSRKLAKKASKTYPSASTALPTSGGDRDVRRSEPFVRLVRLLGLSRDGRNGKAPAETEWTVTGAGIV